MYKSKLGRIIGIFLQIPTFSHGNNAAMCVALLRVAVMYAVFLRFDCGESKQPYSILSIAPFVQKKKLRMSYDKCVSSTCWKEFIHFTIYTSNEVIHFYFGIYSSESKLSIWLTVEINSFRWQWTTLTHPQRHALT